jgi:hypothetical protein
MENGNWINIESLITALNPCNAEAGPCPIPLYNPPHFGVVARSLHSGLVNATMVGGVVRTIDSDIDLKIWRALSTRNGSDSVGEYN